MKFETHSAPSKQSCPLIRIQAQVDIEDEGPLNMGKIDGNFSFLYILLVYTKSNLALRSVMPTGCMRSPLFCVDASLVE